MEGIAAIHGVGAFALITLGVLCTKFNRAAEVIHPRITAQIHAAGVRLLPMIGFIAFAVGFVVIGQTIALLKKVGAQDFAGMIMVTAVVRELGPLVTALLVMARVGTGIVIELSTTRATGELDALEALGIDPIHFLVIPRVCGVAVAVFALTVYMIIISLLSGYIFIFLTDVPLRPGDYFSQIASALTWQDFGLMALKSTLFGLVISLVTCYQGLSRPVRLEDVPAVTTKAVVQSVVACVLLDSIFIVVYLLI